MEKWCIVFYIICASIDSYASEHAKSRICKVLLVPLLMLLLLFEKNNDLYLYLALIFCWIGDLFLIHKTKKTQMAGTLAFLIGHVFYILCFFDMDSYRYFHTYLFYIPYLITIIAYLWKTYVLIPKKYLVLSLIYLFVITFMSYTMFLRLMEHITIPAFISWCGTIFFLISDCLISRQMFLKKKQKWVMQTYSLAQLLIVLGVLYGTVL